MTGYAKVLLLSFESYRQPYAEPLDLSLSDDEALIKLSGVCLGVKTLWRCS
jgi:hypothetical protein